MKCTLENLYRLKRRRKNIMKLSEMNVMLKDDYKIELIKERVIDYEVTPQS